MRRTITTLNIAITAAMFSSLSVSAKDTDLGQMPDSIFMMGALVEAGPSALIGKDKVIPIPFVFYHNKYVTLETTSLYLHPVNTGPLTLSAVGSMRVSNIKMAADDRLKDFDRKLAFEVGGHAGFQISDIFLYGQYLTDVTDAHGGEEITLGLEWEKQIGSVNLSVGGGAFHRSSELGTYLYGVTAKDNASGYVVHEIKSDWYPFAEARASLPLTGRWGLLLTGYAERLPQNATLSPIIEKRHNLKIGAGFTYHF